MAGELERCYEIFGLPPGASLEEIKQVYHELVNVWHPDRFQGDPALQELAEEKLKTINEAYAHLTACLGGRPACPPPWRQIFSRKKLAVPPRSQAPSPLAGRHIIFSGVALAAAVAFLVLAVIFWGKPGEREKSTRGAREVVSRGAGTASRGGFFLGATTQEVLAVMGPPISIHVNTWMYGVSSVTFSQGRVTGYDNVGGNLQLKNIPAADSELAFFTLGATPEEVLAVQGTPTAVMGDTWKYGLSTIKFDNGRVSRYSNLSHNLRVRLTPPPELAANPPAFFELGSTQEEVLAVQGTPTSILPHGWTYGDSTVYFHQGRVIKVNNAGKNLRLKNP